MKVFRNKWIINSIPWLRNPFVFCGNKVSHVIGQTTMNIPEIFSVHGFLSLSVSGGGRISPSPVPEDQKKPGLNEVKHRKRL